MARGRLRRSSGSERSRASSSLKGRADAALRVRTGSLDHGEVDPFGDHGVAPLRLSGEVDAQKGVQVPLQVLPREQHEPRGIGGDALHQPGSEPEVLAFVNRAESCPGQGSGGVEPIDDGVRVRCEGEDDRDASFAGDRGGRQRADVGHPEMDRVDRLGRAQDPMDPALGGDPPRPRLRPSEHALRGREPSRTRAPGRPSRDRRRRRARRRAGRGRSSRRARAGSARSTPSSPRALRFARPGRLRDVRARWRCHRCRPRRPVRGGGRCRRAGRAAQSPEPACPRPDARRASGRRAPAGPRRRGRRCDGQWLSTSRWSSGSAGGR